MMKGRITAGTLLALIQLSGTFVTPVVMLMQNIPKITGIRPVLKHLEAYSHTQEDFPDEEEPSCGPALLKAGITCTDVTFGYVPEQNALQDISLTIAPGTKCALLGESGGGKTTLIKLLTGYYDDFAGDIRYDGIPIGKLSQDKLNRMAAVIHQNIFLFDTDIYNNICLGETFSKEQLDDAVKASGISRFLPGLEKGLHTAVGENGQNLSGGEPGGRGAGASGRGGESVPESLVCGRGAAISDSAAKLGGRGLVAAWYASEQKPPGSLSAAHFT